MSTNALHNAADFAPEKNEVGFLAGLVKPVVDFTIALHKAQAVKDLIKDGVKVEDAYKAVYKKAA